MLCCAACTAARLGTGGSAAFGAAAFALPAGAALLAAGSACFAMTPANACCAACMAARLGTGGWLAAGLRAAATCAAGGKPGLPPAPAAAPAACVGDRAAAALSARALCGLAAAPPCRISAASLAFAARTYTYAMEYNSAGTSCLAEVQSSKQQIPTCSAVGCAVGLESSPAGFLAVLDMVVCAGCEVAAAGLAENRAKLMEPAEWRDAETLATNWNAQHEYAEQRNHIDGLDLNFPVAEAYHCLAEGPAVWIPAAADQALDEHHVLPFS